MPWGRRAAAFCQALLVHPLQISGLRLLPYGLLMVQLPQLRGKLGTEGNGCAEQMAPILEREMLSVWGSSLGLKYILMKAKQNI